jgi:hypothetical protein
MTSLRDSLKRPLVNKLNNKIRNQNWKALNIEIWKCTIKIYYKESQKYFSFFDMHEFPKARYYTDIIQYSIWQKIDFTPVNTGWSSIDR